MNLSEIINGVLVVGGVSAVLVAFATRLYLSTRAPVEDVGSKIGYVLNHVAVDAVTIALSVAAVWAAIRFSTPIVLGRG